MSRIRPWIALLALLGSGGTALKAAGLKTADSGLVLNVRLYAIDPDAVPHVARAVGEAGRVFQKAGLQVRWMDCSPGSQQDAGCEAAPGRHDIRLRIVPGKGGPDLADALGYALPLERGDGVYATVLFGAVQEIRRGTTVSTSQVLGHVMAHEVGHLLLENAHHSRNGLMSANWDHSDLQRIAQREMLFSEAQTRRIQDRARLRMQADRDYPSNTIAASTTAHGPSPSALTHESPTGL